MMESGASVFSPSRLFVLSSQHRGMAPSMISSGDGSQPQGQYFVTISLPANATLPHSTGCLEEHTSCERVQIFPTTRPSYINIYKLIMKSEEYKRCKLTRKWRIELVTF
jgi:hypothetical protein